MTDGFDAVLEESVSLEQTQGHWVKVVIYHSGWEFLDAHWQIV